MTTPAPTPATEIRHYAAAGYAAVAIETVEEERFTAALFAGLATPPGSEWSAVYLVSASGLRKLPGGEAAQTSYPEAFALAAASDRVALIVLDAQHVLRNAPLYRRLRDALPALRSRGSLVFLVAPRWTLPAELEREVPVLRWALPTRDQLASALDTVANAAGVPAPQGAELPPLLAAASGLTLGEAENAAALAYVVSGRLDPGALAAEKLRQIQGTGYMEVWHPTPLDSIGGLGELKRYLTDEVVPACGDADLAVRGMLLVGVPGTGKSLACRAVSAALEWPAVRLDIAACKGSLVGESERRIRDALARAEAIAPCVLVVDEIEKAVGGYLSSAATDSGVTLGMVGALLTWLQDHRASIVTVATCNNYALLPAELTRAGRFDERFFVDLPTPSERAEIAAIHLARFGGDSEMAGPVAQLADSWTGAEIEQLVRSAARRSRRQLTPEALAAAARDIHPIAKVREAEIKALRDWARGSLRLANTADTEALSTPTGRRIAPAGTGAYA